jgi:hypothetical protein
MKQASPIPETITDEAILPMYVTVTLLFSAIVHNLKFKVWD